MPPWAVGLGVVGEGRGRSTTLLMLTLDGVFSWKTPSYRIWKRSAEEGEERGMSLQTQQVGRPTHDEDTALLAQLVR